MFRIVRTQPASPCSRAQEPSRAHDNFCEFNARVMASDPSVADALVAFGLIKPDV
jgi:hypothetical protein